MEEERWFMFRFVSFSRVRMEDLKDLRVVVEIVVVLVVLVVLVALVEEEVLEDIF